MIFTWSHIYSICNNISSSDHYMVSEVKMEPPELEGNLLENWSGINASNYTSKQAALAVRKKTKAATLLHVVRTEALEVYNTFTWDSAGDEMKVEPIMAAYCNPRKKCHLEKTHIQHQKSFCPLTTSWPTYAWKLRREFSGLTACRIVEGVRNDSTHSRLLREPTLTL